MKRSGDRYLVSEAITDESRKLRIGISLFDKLCREAKGSVKSDKTGLAHVFRAAITRERFLSDRLLELADKVCDGTTMPLVMALVDKQAFTADELAEFRRLLDEAARTRAGKKTRPNH